MKRREFLKSSLTATSVGALASTLNVAAADPAASPTLELYELRLYHLRRGPKQNLFDDFYQRAAIPAMSRAGIGPVGVFNVMIGADSPTMYVLIPHKSFESFTSANERVRADREYQSAGDGFINAPAGNAAYVRVESSLLRAFTSMPTLEIPAATAGNKSRIFELRTYESHSKAANKKKIEMFNTGEIGIFRRTGLQPVFFGETLVGGRMPSLTYMLTFESMAAHDKAWSAFGSDPDWKQLSSTPGYTDPEIVSNISNLLLRPVLLFSNLTLR